MSEPVKAIANLLLLLLLARIQSWIPGGSLPLLAAGAFVLMVRRPMPEAAVCLLWAGIIGDALEGTQLLISAFYFLLVFLVRGLRGHFAAGDHFSFGTGVCCGLFCGGHLVWRALWSEFPPLSTLLWAIPLGTLAGVLVSLALTSLDRHAGRLAPASGKEDRP